MVRTISNKLLISCLIGAMIVSACGQATTSSAPTQVEKTGQISAPATDATSPLPESPPATEGGASPATMAESAPATTTAPVAEAQIAEVLPPEPQDVEFQADDGQSLQGRYYPAAVKSAPLVVLMHWAPGDQNEWNAIAPWLQNRGQPKASHGNPWLDASWFPPMLKGQSFAVFTFTFRNCAGGCKSFTRDAWLLDAQAAMRKAQQLEGIDPNRIIAIGASIGADGAADGCGWLNTQSPNSCLGALSLSPGDYLTIPYKDAVSALGAEQPPRRAKPAWCLYSEEDTESVRACEAASGNNYRSIKYAGDNHGMYLLQPDVKPSPMQMILDFLKLALGE